MTELTVHGAVLASARHQPARTAIVFEGREMTYGELERDIRRLSGALSGRLGLPRGARVGVLMSNRPEFYVAVLAISHAGLVAVPVPSGSTGRELEHVAADSAMSALLVEHRLAERLGDALEELESSGLAVHDLEQARRSGESVLGLIACGSPLTRAAVVSGSDPFFFGYTSGTTGRPKGAVCSQHARAALALLFGQEYGCHAASDRALVATPLYHGGGLSRGLAPLIGGGSVVVHRHFEPAAVLAAFASGEVNAAYMVPTMFAAMFELAEREVVAAGTHPVTILSNAAALPEHLKDRILESWPSVRLFEIYGSTEAGTVSSLRPEDQRRKQRCVGPPLAFTEVELRSPDGGEVPTGEDGELFSRSPFVFSGYHNNPDATATALRDGWVSVGDLPRRDEEGYLYIVGRLAEKIVSGGVNVYPREVEEVIAAHPAVRAVAVLGLPDPYWGERVHASVVALPGVELTVEQLRAHCRERLAGPKVPRSFDLRPGLPVTGTGKVAKYLLREELSGVPAPAGPDGRAGEG